jgi:hypothetical protein
MKTLGSLDFPMMNTPENLNFLVYLAPASELVYQKNICSWYNSESQLHCLFITGKSWIPGELGQKVFQQTNFDWLLGIFITGESWLQGDEYMGRHDFTGANTPGSWLRIWKTPWILEQIINPSLGMSKGPGELFDEKMTKSLDISPLNPSCRQACTEKSIHYAKKRSIYFF